MRGGGGTALLGAPRAVGAAAAPRYPADIMRINARAAGGSGERGVRPGAGGAGGTELAAAGWPPRAPTCRGGTKQRAGCSWKTGQGEKGPTTEQLHGAGKADLEMLRGATSLEVLGLLCVVLFFLLFLFFSVKWIKGDRFAAACIYFALTGPCPAALLGPSQELSTHQVQLPPSTTGSGAAPRGRGAPAPHHSGGSGTSSLLGARHILHYTEGTNPNPAPAQAARVPEHSWTAAPCSPPLAEGRFGAGGSCSDPRTGPRDPRTPAQTPRCSSWI